MGRKRSKPSAKEDETILRLPSHITLEILSRLPIKTIMVCTRVCKAWGSVVSDPCFPQIHLAKSSLSLMFCSWSGDCWLTELEKGFSSRKRKISKFNHHETNVHGIHAQLSAVSSCNGLLCMAVTWSQHEDYRVYVWNPIKNDCVALPIPNIKVGNKLCSLGLGFCLRTNVYKVIRVVSRIGMMRMRTTTIASSNKEATTPICEIYTLGTNAWRTVQDVPVPHHGDFISKMPLNGAFHWISTSNSNPDVINIDENFLIWVCAFRIKDEKWDSILMPSNFEPRGRLPFSVQLEVVENCLVILDRSKFSLINIWMMKEYGVRESWTKCWSIQVGHSPSYLPQLVPLKLTKDGKLLIFGNNNRTLACFDPRTGILRKRRINYLPNKGRGIAYVPSFISPTQIMKEER